MSKTATINVRADKNLKEKVDDIFSKLGISASEAINMFYSQVLINQALPFEVSLKPSKHLADSIKQHKEGKTEKFDNVESALSALKL